MTNAAIILDVSVRLMNDGILKGTGRFLDVVNEDGSTEKLEIPEEIHTFNAWKQRGFIVRKGEHAVASFPIWKYVTRKNASDEPLEAAESANEFCRMKLIPFLFCAASRASEGVRAQKGLLPLFLSPIPPFYYPFFPKIFLDTEIR